MPRQKSIDVDLPFPTAVAPAEHVSLAFSRLRLTDHDKARKPLSRLHPLAWCHYATVSSTAALLTVSIAPPATRIKLLSPALHTS